ncbi:hypothetical protein BJ875DRAFT_546339 [Amylocarpus encephaloides]|uniref:Uncharacterized protein n=1 Tax=Amylocarpus encephaloides TaxID=45428 RepID=A0A9P8C1A2_9HELO|nr:hypothetical protein BJ875DRAFT_546339 [Amylocarpus encephaloides]
MSLSEVAEVFGRWTRLRRHDYMRVRAHNENNRHPEPRTSFAECLEGDDPGRFESWPNLTIEDDYRSQHDQPSLVSSAATWTVNHRHDNQRRQQLQKQYSHAKSTPVKPLCNKISSKRDVLIIILSLYLTTPNTNTRPALIGSSSFIRITSLHQLKSTYRHSLPFLSALILFIGTLIFLLTITTGLPGVLDLTNTTILYLGNLFPGTLGGVIFTASSLITTINCQDCWYIVGAWIVIGSIRFTLASALFFIGTTEASFQATLASWWGSCAFLIGSWLQCTIVQALFIRR